MLDLLRQTALFILTALAATPLLRECLADPYPLPIP
jgi:hypothetical protein